MSDSSGTASSCNISRFELRNQNKTTQQWGLQVTTDIVLNQVRVYHDRVYADNVLSNFWFVISFSSQHHSKKIDNNATENISQVRTKECKTRSFVCKVNLNFLRPSRHFDCDDVFTVIVSLLNESVHGFKNIRKGNVKPGF